MEDRIYLLLFAVCKNGYAYYSIITMNCIQIYMVHTYVFTFIFICECQSCNYTKTNCYEVTIQNFSYYIILWYVIRSAGGVGPVLWCAPIIWSAVRICIPCMVINCRWQVFFKTSGHIYTLFWWFWNDACNFSSLLIGKIWYISYVRAIFVQINI